MSETSNDDYSVAIIGMAGCFPGAANVHQFWQNLCRGVESVHTFTDEELLKAGESPRVFSRPDYVRVAPVLDAIDKFDAGFFGLSPRDASLMDPQHRLFLEVAWHALENAGYAPGADEAPVGVFAACGMNSYMMHHLVTNSHIMRTVGEWLVRHAGNDMNFLSTRASYHMNLKGPSANVQTACSSSLVALHYACQSLFSGECELALVGASTIVLPQDRGYTYKDGEIMSSSGHCRPFDARSDGTLFGSGAGCVVVKRLEQARSDGDNILAIVRGSAINNDGAEKVGYLAPSVEGQTRVVAEALGVAGVQPSAIGFVETHGTGTAVGDPIEIAALASAFDDGHHRAQKCVIGSVKANIGHLGEAAGMASLIKAILCLQHRKLPPTINYQSPNPELNLETTPFEVRTQLTEWLGTGAPLMAGVTSLGAGGTNAHVILEGAPTTRLSPPPSTLRRPELLLVSAKTKEAAQQASGELAEYLSEHADVSLTDAAYTLWRGRKLFPYRTFALASGHAGIVEECAAAAKNVQLAPTADARVIFMFPGGGAQYEGMGQELYQSEPVYRRAIVECLDLLPQELSERVRQLFFEPAIDGAKDMAQLEAPSLALPALFATEYALAEQLEAWGVRPDAYIGHSMGEYVAACRSGVLQLADALMLVLARGRLFETLPEGAMLSIEMPESQLEPLLGPELSIAAANADTLCVASGPIDAINALERVLRERQVEMTRLHISVAAHSKMLEPILAEFLQICKGVRFGEMRTPFVSTLTGTWITNSEARDPDYWVRHLRHTVRFGDGVRTALGDTHALLIEVGPGRTLASLARMSGAKSALTTLRHPNEVASDIRFLLTTVGRAWQNGAPIDFSKLFSDERPRRVPLPGYAFQRQSYWIEPGQRTEAAANDEFQRIEDLDQWFQVPTWYRAPSPPKAEQAEHQTWLWFGGPARLAKRVAASRQGKTIVVKAGAAFAKESPLAYVVCPSQKEDWDRLFEELKQQGAMPNQIVHLLGHTSALVDLTSSPGWLMGERYQVLEKRYFGSLLALGQAVARLEVPMTLSVVANRVFHVDAGPPPEPHKSLLVGPVLVIPREVPHVRCRLVDVAGRTDETLLHELAVAPEQTVVALRGGTRWARRLVPSPIADGPAKLEMLPEGCVVVVSGGLGGIGLTLATHLARVKHAKLVLLGRSELPAKSEWQNLVRKKSTPPALVARLKKLLEIEEVGGRVLTFSADVTIEEHIVEVRAAVRAEFGPVDVVIHTAGSIHDSPLELKTMEEAHSVMASKALGAMVLERVFGRDQPSLFVGCSSVSSILGLPGQSDYAAANAFLEAFVEGAPARGKFGRAISIGWNAWRDVGMAVSVAERSTTTDTTLGGRVGPHPCLERVVAETDSRRLFATQFSRTKHWLVAEHVVANGEALIPGTGYLEMARAGLELEPEALPVRIANVVFASPFFVGSGTARELFLELTLESDSRFSFIFYSASKQDPHVSGTVEYVHDPAPSVAVPLAVLRERFSLSIVPGKYLDQSFMGFGPRWGNIQAQAYGDGEALIHLVLAHDFILDLGSYRMHPALLDMATGGAQRLIPGFDAEADFYVPFAYESLTLYDDLPAEIYSHVQLRSSFTRGSAVFDVSLYAPDGVLVLAVRGFTMQRIDRQFAEGMDVASPNSQVMSHGPRPAELTQLIQTGIAPAEGATAFTRILESRLTGTLYASSVDIHAWLRRLDTPPAAPDVQGDASAFERPQLETVFIAPRNQIEMQLASYWTELLGMKSIGVEDDFFELGGHSLVAVRLFNKIRRGFDVDLPLSSLFEAPNIAALARVIAEESGVEPAPLTAVSAASQNGTSDSNGSARANGSANGSANGNTVTHDTVAAAATSPGKRWTSLINMQPRGDLTPFFCVAGMGGNLHNLRKLALFWGQSRPIYGLQPPGANDVRELLYTVEALAEHYIKALRTVQPHGPYCLGGYSGGGVVAFEMARQLSAAGERIAFLGFLDSFSPVLPQRPLAERARIHLNRLRQSGGLYALGTLRRRLQYERGRLGLKLLLLTAERAPQEGEQRYAVLAASWVEASSRYHPDPFEGEATLFRAKEPGVLSNWTAYDIDDKYGWGPLLTHGVHVEVCPGNHSDMCEEPHVRTLAAKLRDAVDRATAEFEVRRKPVRRRSTPGEGTKALEAKH